MHCRRCYLVIYIRCVGWRRDITFTTIVRAIFHITLTRVLKKKSNLGRIVVVPFGVFPPTVMSLNRAEVYRACKRVKSSERNDAIIYYVQWDGLS